MIKSVTYSAILPGRRLLVLGAVHGTETCGTVALQRVMAEIDSGSLPLIAGQVTFIPVANPQAYAEKKRFIERNLNRYLVPMEIPDSYEARLGNILCPIIASCDVLLDLHSTTIGGAAFASVEGDDVEENNFASALGAQLVVSGWAEAYEAAGRVASDPDESVGTTAYARRFGAKAVLLECGQHQDPQAPEIAYAAVRKALAYWGLTEELLVESKPVPHLLVKRVYYREDGGVLVQNWPNFSPVKKGETLAFNPAGEPLMAPDDGFVVLTNPTVNRGGEWFYFGVEKEHV